jgi:peptidoglycan/xylan/chitin deacetylase (PgdA/CDA1 family)
MTPNVTFRRRMLIAAMAAFAVVMIGVAAAVTSAVISQRPAPLPAAHALASYSRVPMHYIAHAPADAVPVLVYHEMNNGCAATAPTCKTAKDYETVSTAQFRAEMAWMYAHGYHTVTVSQYLAWVANRDTPLPTRPFLITVDNGIANFLEGAQPILWHYRYTATAFLVTGFADAASGQCAPHIMGVNVQPGCPVSSSYWDATWQQLEALSPAVYNFGIEAGASGHYVQNYNHHCPAFNACLLPGETFAHYVARVKHEYAAGMEQIRSHLGNRFDPGAWVVPYSDLGYPCRPVSCALEAHNDHGWLMGFAARWFKVAFVQDAYRNGIRHERYRYEVHATTTLRAFRAALNREMGAFRWA